MTRNNESLHPIAADSLVADGSQRRLAVLIDADNAQAATIEGLLAEVAKYGVASVKRIYGDWTKPTLGSWKKVLLQHSIQPVQQFAYTSGKNSTDSALIIDAMDLLYTRRFDGFCLVSSDSDFTRLAARLREGGMTVYGFGEKKTPEPFVSACDKFIYTEVLRPEEQAAPAAAESPPPASQPEPQIPVDLITKAIDDVSEDSGWAHLGAVGSNLTKVKPDFDPRLYGFRKLRDLVKSLPRAFEVEERSSPGATGKAVYVRNKNARTIK
ncbi:MAG: NYN domain-containing protein [Gammaproteobacteria bacterium]